jgi:hypothetical protein
MKSRSSKRRTWVFDPHSGGRIIPPAARERTQARIEAYARKHYRGKYTRQMRYAGMKA